MGAMKEVKNARSNRKGADKRQTGTVPFADRRFVRIELTSKERDDCRALCEAGEFKHVSVTDFVDEGYKVSFSSDGRGGGYLCTVSMANADHHNAGLSLTGRGGTPERALEVAAYKHFNLCEDTLWREAEDRRGGSYDDIG